MSRGIHSGFLNGDSESWENIASARRPKGYSFFCTSDACCKKPYVTNRKMKDGTIKPFTYYRIEAKVMKFNSVSLAVNDVCPDCKHTLFSSPVYTSCNPKQTGDNADAN